MNKTLPLTAPAGLYIKVKDAASVYDLAKCFCHLTAFVIVLTVHVVLICETCCSPV